MQQRVPRWVSADLALIIVLFVLSVGLVQWSYRSAYSGAFTMNSPAFLTPRYAFHGVETFPDGSRFYRWTTGNSRLQLPNPGGPSIVHLVVAGGPAGTVPVALHHDGARVPLLVAPELRTYSLLLPAAHGERINLFLLSPVITTPERDIGIVVSNVYLAAGGSAPTYVVLVTLLAVIGGYGILRRIGWPTARAAGYIGLLLIIAITWHVAGGWQYGLFAVLLAILAQATITLILAYRALTDASNYRRLAMTALLISTAFYTLLYFLMPIGRTVIFREDSFVESVSVAWFGFSFVTSLFFLLRSRHLRRLALSMLPVFALLCLLDELSFGERFFSLNMPIFYDVKFDGLHDVVDILVVWLTDPPLYKVELGITLVIGLIAALILLRYARPIVAEIAYFRSSPPFGFFVGSLIFLAAALLIDTELYNNEVALILVEELLEMNAAILLLFAGTSLGQMPSRRSAQMMQLSTQELQKSNT